MGVAMYIDIEIFFFFDLFVVNFNSGVNFMNSQFRKNGLMTVLSAGVFAASSFAAMNAYAKDSCLVCWSPDSNLCGDMNQPGTSAGYEPPEPGPGIDYTPPPVVWMSCYERHFRTKFGADGEFKAVNATSCEAADVEPDQYSTWINLPDPEDYPGSPGPGVYSADKAWWYPDMNCADLRKEGYIPKWVPRKGDPLEYTPICLVRNDGLNNETVSGIGILAPGATGLLPGACPAN